MNKKIHRALLAIVGFLIFSTSVQADTDVSKLDLFTNKAACALNDYPACVYLALIYQNGEGVKQDYLKAVKFYTKTCDGGEGVGCLSLGVMYQYGEGVKQDDFKAKELYGKACDGGDADGCKNYAILNKK